MATTTENLKAFADAVLSRIATAPEAHRFGRKMFLAELRPSKHTARLLIEAHKAGLLELSRCDLTQAFDAKTVAASEIPHMHTRFHFVAPR